MSLRPLVLVALSAFLAVPAAAEARTLILYKTSIDVDLTLTQKSHWEGIRPGCFAPAENFDATYRLDIDTTRAGKDAKIKTGTTTITAESHGTTSTFGDAKSFKQRMVSAPWELQTAYPAGAACPSEPPPPPPEWASSPTCKAIDDRVMASIVGSSAGAGGGGSLLINRVRRQSASSTASTVGFSCYRTLHPIHGEGVDSEIGIDQKATYIQIPIPGLKRKLEDLAKEKSFTVKVSVSGDCNEMRMKPRITRRADFTRNPFTQPHEFLGSFNGEKERSACLIAGDGKVTVRRIGKATRTELPG